MSKQYKVIGFIFNAGKFGIAIRNRINMSLTAEDIAQAAGVADTTIITYASGQENNMKMQSFLAVCNALDLNALDYIELEDM